MAWSINKLLRTRPDMAKNGYVNKPKQTTTRDV